MIYFFLINNPTCFIIKNEYEWIEFNITHLVQNEYKLDEERISLVLKIQNTGKSYMARFYSKEASSYNPYLDIIYN